MRLLSLEVENYRNIASASLTPGRELTVICSRMSWMSWTPKSTRPRN